ncbi:MAG: hypothetical protein AAF502_23550, partial [Bacteroidota bacterium]
MVRTTLILIILTFVAYAAFGQIPPYQWGYSIGSQDTDWGWEVLVDGSGNIYNTGFYTNTTDFDLGPGISTLSAPVDSDIYLSKYDADGNFLWAVNANADAGAGTGLAVDGSGNIIVTGQFQGSPDFDPGPGVTSFTSNGVNDVFIAKYSSAGALIWARAFGGAGFDETFSVSVDNANNIYLTGMFQGTVDLDPTAGVNMQTSAGQADAFVMKLDANGNYTWALAFGGTNFDYGEDVDVDASGNVFVTGWFRGTTDLDPGPANLAATSVGNDDMFFSKFDANGNLIWAHAFGGSGNDEGTVLNVDNSNNVFLAGHYTGTIDFDPNAGNVTLTNSAPFQGIFLAKYDNNGNILWINDLKASTFSQTFGISIGPSDKIGISGIIQGTIDFDPGAGTENISSVGPSNDMFIAEYSQSTGAYQDVQKMGSEMSGGERATSLSYDPVEGIVFTGVFGEEFFADPPNNNVELAPFSSNSPNLFLIKYGPAPLLTGTISNVIDALCNGSSTGSATANPGGGAPPYSFIWDSGETSTSATALSPGSNTVTITDGAGQNLVLSISINEPAPINPGVSITQNISCNGASDGVAASTPSGGSGPYTYFWDTGSTDQNTSFLWPGPHTVTVTDQNGCVGTASFSITEPNELNVSVSFGSDASCNGASDGSATASATGGTPPYTYDWDNGEMTATANGLNAGSHIVTVTDNNGCMQFGFASINEPSQVFASASLNNDASGNGLSDGSATAFGAGGSPPYSYNWDNGEMTATANMLDAGNHIVTVSDQNGCSATAAVSVSEPPPLIVSENSSTPDNDANCDGTVNINVSGGVPGYTFLWSNGNTIEDPNDLCAGTNTVTVTDANGITSTLSISIGSNSSLILSGVNVNADAICNGTCNGSATVSVSGGAAPFTYSWNDPGGQNTPTANALCAGNYSVTVQDNSGASVIGMVTISEPPPLLASTSLNNNVSGNGLSDGSATANGSGGTPPYTYNWDNSEMTQTANMLNAGNHLVTVTDQNGCANTASVSITEPSLLVVSENASSPANDANCDGTADILVSGGVPGYTFQWSNGNTNEDPNDLCAGTNSVTVTDANGITSTLTISIGSNSTLSFNNATADNNASCQGVCDGAATVSVSGGSLPYTFLWDDPSAQTNTTATGLCAGTFNVTIQDNSGTAVTGMVSITEPSALSAIASVNNNVSGNGLSDGSATAITSGGTMPYTYNWDNGEMTQTANMLNAGNHIVTVTDQNGCSETASVMITEPGAILITEDGSTPDNDTNCDGSVDITVSGGVPGYTFQWSNGNTNEDPDDLCAGANSVTITDANGVTT